MHPTFPAHEYMVSVTRDDRTRYYYGQTLTEAITQANVAPGEDFCYARFERGPVRWGELIREGSIRTSAYTERRSA